jgi:site-specific recombinase XerD
MTLEGNRSDLAVLREKQIPGILDQFIEAFGAGNRKRGQRYVLALRRFLGEPPPEDAPWNYVGTLSPKTRSVYAATLEEFFEWLAREHDGVVPPELVTTIDVERYVQWLSAPSYTLNVEKLRDGDRTLRLAIFETVQKLGSADRNSVYSALPRSALKELSTDEPIAELSHELGRMVLHQHLTRVPSLEQIRRDVPLAGIRVFRLVVADDGRFAMPGDGVESVDMDDLFIYRVPEPKGIGRRTIVKKLAALSSFWETLREGENIPGGEAVLQHNIVSPVLKRVSRGIAQESKAASRSQKPDPSTIVGLLRASENPSTLAQYRDRALLLFLLFTGVRVEEAVSLRRGAPSGSAKNRYAGWFQGGDPPTVRILRKGGRQQVLPYPPMALEALTQFQTKLAAVAASPDAQSVDPRGTRYVPSDSPRWRYAELSRRADAPLFPSLYLWGANSTANYERFKPNAEVPPEKPLTTRAVRYVLDKLAKKGGAPGGIHPHALRHFAAVAMFRGGKPLTEIQEMLGHESITTTERYIQELVTEIEHSGQNEILRYLQQFGEPEERFSRPAPDVIDVRGEPVKQAKKPTAQKAPQRPAERRSTAQPRRSALRPPTPESVDEARDLERQARSEGLYDLADSYREMAERMAHEERRQPPQIQQIDDAVLEAFELPPDPVPQNILPVAPDPDVDPVEVALTTEGPAVEFNDRLVAVGGEIVQHGVTPRLLGNKSSGSPDWVYEALAEVASADAMSEFAAANAERNRIYKEKAPTEKAQKDERKKKLDGANKRILAAKKQLQQFGYDPIEWTYVKPRNWGKKDLGAHLVVHVESKPGSKAVEHVQLNEWLIKHYHPWPVHYGIGKTSLLPWFGRGEASSHGYVTLGRSLVPPVPVPSPEQVNPQTQFGARFLDCANALYAEWMDGDPQAGVGPSPTRALGVVRWYAMLSHLTVELHRYIQEKKTGVTWQPWNAVCTVGKDIRSHEDAWICKWLRENAHTYTTAVTAFERLVEIKREEGDEAFETAYRQGVFEGLTPADDLPAWMADDDPVHAIYEASPKEWDRFSDWIGSVTGQQLSAERRNERREQRRFVKKDVQLTMDQLEGQLRYFYEQVDLLKRGTGTVTLASGEQVEITDEMREDARMQRDLLKEDMLRRWGIDLDDEQLRALSRRERIKAILAEAFPDGVASEADEGSEESKNTLGDSKLFDPRYFRLNRADHTISHTEAFREEFFQTYQQDSELVMRRAARAMWEYVKEKLQKGPLPSKEYSYLYAMMLSYISWVVPAGDEMERQIRKRAPGAVDGGAARRRWIRQDGEIMRALLGSVTAEMIEDTEQRSHETDAEWRKRILPLVREGSPEDVILDEDNVVEYLTRLKEGIFFAAEQIVPGVDVVRAIRSEVAGTEAGGEIFEPGAGRRQRKEFEREKREAEGEAPPLRRTLADFSDEELAEKGLMRRPDGTVVVKPQTANYRAHISNAARPIELTDDSIRRCSRYVRNAGLVLPSPFSMIQAMNERPGRRGLLGGLFG